MREGKIMGDASLPPRIDVTSINLPMRHPGPRTLPRVQAVPTRLQQIDITFSGTRDMETAIAAGFDAAGLSSGFIEFTDLACSALQYVIPAKFEFPDRMAWYSAPRPSRGDAVIRSAYMSVGRDKGAGFSHCHGHWDIGRGRHAMGHLLAPLTWPKAGQTVTGFGFRSASLDRTHDPETDFELFTVTSAGTPCNAMTEAIVANVRPDEDITTACAQLCAQHGIAQARVIGLGSLNGAAFEGMATMRDSASEFFITAGHATPTTARLNIAVVDSSANVFEGALAPGQGRVSITSELVLLPAGRT